MDIAEIRKKARKLKEEAAAGVDASTFVKADKSEKEASENLKATEEAELERIQAELEAKAGEDN